VLAKPCIKKKNVFTRPDAFITFAKGDRQTQIISKPMKLQIIQDGKGKNAGVFIPYNQWQQLKKQHKELEGLEGDEQTSKEQVLNNIKKGLKEVHQYRQGKLKTKSSKDFLNEL
jgi:hypothetical protein